jgi:rhamnose utilization protein RhaD (predicted bifunctional aldolase and dehydrogenase)/NAD(P)-dependent dehydrogenase (short-subunit alcohol dehydrogenase family)
MWVKGSGADMRGSSAGDYPALRLDDLLPLLGRDDMSDEEMTDLVARALLDPGARRPSIETLLHAFLPYTHIDHVHADAICALTNHPEGPRIVAEALGDGFAYVDWMRPGFTLSKVVADLGDRDGVVLAHHGLITWGESSDECWQRTEAAVDRARAYLDALPLRVDAPAHVPDMPEEEVERLLLRLRGAMSRTGRRVLRIDTRLRAAADHPLLSEIVAAGVSSADHMLRIKPRSVVSTSPDTAADDIDGYATEYSAYVERNSDAMPEGFGMHDPMPRVVLVPGLGAVTTGGTLRDAEVAADIALHTHGVAATVADRIGTPVGLDDRETFRFDYWPMELYKLTLRPPAPDLAGFIAIVTGSASGIGRGIALELAARGASLVLADLDGAGLDEAGASIREAGGTAPVLVAGDQSDESVVEDTVRQAVRTFGGLDGAVINAGIGVTGTLEELTLDQWNAAMRINLASGFLMTRATMRVIKEQGSGGSLVYVASKNAFGPGAGFGAYSVSKAGMVQLMRIAALEGGAAGIRANAINPDAVFDNSRLWDGGLREERAAAHGIAPEELEDFYAARNLLKRRVTTADVARTAAFLLSDASSRSTGAVFPVDGGVAGAFPR